MGDNSKKVREAEEEVREAGDVYPPASPPPPKLQEVQNLASNFITGRPNEISRKKFLGKQIGRLALSDYVISAF